MLGEGFAGDDVLTAARLPAAEYTRASWNWKCEQSINQSSGPRCDRGQQGAEGTSRFSSPGRCESLGRRAGAEGERAGFRLSHPYDTLTQNTTCWTHTRVLVLLNNSKKKPVLCLLHFIVVFLVCLLESLELMAKLTTHIFFLICSYPILTLVR